MILPRTDPCHAKKTDGRREMGAPLELLAFQCKDLRILSRTMFCIQDKNFETCLKFWLSILKT